MIKYALAVTALALVACAPPVPESGAGVGFQNYGDYNSYRSVRDAELRGAAPPVASASVVTVRPPSPPSDDAPITSAALGEVGIGRTSTAPVIQTRTAIDTDNPAISDEQDFSAVAGRQTIESDAERLRAQRDAYEVIAPTALPSRSGNDGPNIVQFALTSSNAVGQKVYARSALSTGARYLRNCDKYSSPDLAQEAFLRSGGPQRDKMGIDPDGDGFACSWDPTPFRRASASNG